METTYRVTDVTSWRELDGEIVALDTKESVYFAIGGVGTVLWPLLVAGASKQELIDKVMSTFPDVAQSQVCEDLEEFIGATLDSGLIEAETS